MIKKQGLRKLGALALVSTMLFGLTACNTKLKVDYGYNPSDYVTLGEYKGLKAQIDIDKIVEENVQKAINSDIEEQTTYNEVDRGAQDGDTLMITASGKISGMQIDELSAENKTIVLGKDTFALDGVYSEFKGMKSGESKVLVLDIPNDTSKYGSYSGNKIVYDLSVSMVAQTVVPMITDAYVKSTFGYENYDAYKKAKQASIQDAIDEEIEIAKKEAILSQLIDICKVNDYPNELIEQKKKEYESSINFYALMQKISVDEYCKKTYGYGFDEYVKRACAQTLILQAIAQQEGFVVMEYDYKANLQGFAERMGYTNKETFLERYGKDTIVQQMLITQAQDLVMDSAVIN